MQVIETLSVEEAAAALGLRPAAIRLRIKSGEIAAALVGRKFRVSIASVNALLVGAGPACRPTTRPASSYDPSFPQPSASPPSQHAAQPVAQVVAQQPATTSPFDSDDMVWINRYRRDLASPDPEVRRAAKWQLDQFVARAEQDATRRVAARMSPEECRAATAAIMASSPTGSGW